MSDKATAFDITPETKVGSMLDRFPELEEALIAMSPAFARLRNPVLRKTIARVATLKQVAKIGELPLAELINRLRTAVVLEAAAVQDDSTQGLRAAPAWVRKEKVVTTFDARPLIESGGHPLGKVMEDLKALKPGEVYLLLTPFMPAPLLDMAKSKGFQSFSQRVAPTLFENYLIGAAADTSFEV